MQKAIIGKKVGMTQIFDETGRLSLLPSWKQVPVSLL